MSRLNETWDRDGNLIESIVSPYTAEEKAAHLEVYAKGVETEPLTVDGFTENFTEEHRRNLKEAVDLLREIGAAETAEIMWRGTIPVTLATAVSWLVSGGQKRQKRFVAQGEVNVSDYDTLEAIEAAFDAEMAT